MYIKFSPVIATKQIVTRFQVERVDNRCPTPHSPRAGPRSGSHTHPEAPLGEASPFIPGSRSGPDSKGKGSFSKLTLRLCSQHF